MPEGLIHFRAIDFTMPLLKHNVHLVVDIMQFPKDAKTMRCWKEFSKPPLWHDPDCELVAMWNEAETSQASTSSTTVTSAPRSDASLAAGMDVQLAPSGEDTDELRPGLRQDDGGSSDAGIPANVMASSSHSSRDAGAHQQGPKRVQARVLQEVRQQTQEVRQVPRVRDKIPVERSYKGPGGGFAATIALVTIATSLLRQYHVASNSCTAPGQFEQGQAQAQGLSQSTSLYYDFLDWYHRGEGKDLELDPYHGRAGRDTKHVTRGDCNGPPRLGGEQGLPTGACSGHRSSPGLKHESGTQPSSSCSRQRFGRNGVRLGTGRRLRGTLKNNINNLESGVKIYEALRSVAERPPPHIDILELFSGTSKLTIHASKHHLNALQPMDLNHGQDFHDPQVRKTIILAMKKFKPWLAMIGIRCTKWSRFNINLNYSWRPDQLRQEQEAEMPLVDFTCDACEV